jgi:zinc transport system substrate-binding protein
LKKLGFVFAIILVVNLAVGILFSGCAAEDSAKIKVVTSTSLISQIVERVGGDMVSAVNIIPPAQCPGHFDIKPGDVQVLSNAQLFIIHNWQGEKFSDELIASADNENLVKVMIEVPGNWMTPTVQREAADKIAAALIQIDPDNSAYYQNGADEYKAAVTAKESEINARLSQVNLSAINVLCDEQQTGFVAWTGLNIIATYGRPETFTPQVVKDLVDLGREGNVTLVIDNMQTGGESGKALAEELGVAHIVLSNFPGGYENTDTWEQAIDMNIDLILDAINE